MNWLKLLFGRKPARIRITCLCGKSITMKRNGQPYAHKCVTLLEGLEKPGINIDEGIEELLNGKN
jgi:hypothetical protein